MVLLQTERLIIRDPKLEDAAGHHQVLSDELTLYYWLSSSSSVQTTPVGKIVGAGYAILPEHRGQGYATEAFHALIRFAFEENDVYRFVAGCRAENKASERMMQKCGMVKEAEFKCHTWHDGQMKDRVEYRLLKEEYQQKLKDKHSGGPYV